jgi:SAM-dependent methyltransferase
MRLLLSVVGVDMSVYSSNKLSKFGPNDAWVKLFELVPKGSKVLDIGCSSGNLGHELKQQKGVHVVGIDIDQADLDEASKRLDEVHLLNVESDDLSGLGQFDVIVMADVIEHLFYPVPALKKIRKLLKPKGRLVFSIPNMANVTTRVELLKGRFEYKDFGLLDRTHIHFYDEVEVNRVFMESGLNVVRTDCTVRDIPEKILIQDLDSVGIKLTPKLSKHLKESKGLIYQFIGYAVASNKPKPFKGATSSDLDSVSKMMREAEEQVSRLTAESESAKSKTQALQKHLDEVNAELQGILQSKGWKALEKAHRVKHVLTGGKKKKPN